MALKLPETLIASKSFKMSEFTSKGFNLYDDAVPKQLRQAFLSQNSSPPSASSVLSVSTLTVNDDTTIEVIVKKGTARELYSAQNSSSADVLMPISDEEEENSNDTDSWETASMCPNDCNCGNCPMAENEDEEMKSHEISFLSLMPNFSSISLVDQANQNLSITRVIPLRNYGVIVRWDVMNHHGIRGYKVFMDGIEVSAVHSPSRMSAVIENVNMKAPHHFAVSVQNISEKMPTTPCRNMHAVYLYKPNNFIH